MNDETQKPLRTSPPVPVPLPWMTGESIKNVAAVKRRPPGLSLTVGLIVVDDLIALFFISPEHWHSVGRVLFHLIFRLFDLWIICYLWKGRNWARLLLMIGSVLSLLTVTLLHKETPIHQVHSVSSMALGAYLFYWFSTKPIVRFFKAPGNAVSEPGAEVS